MKFTKPEMERIEAAVSHAESLTSGEIVVMAVGSSSSYFGVRAVWAGLGWLTASIALELFERSQSFPFPVWEILSWQLLGAGLGAALSYFSPFLRLLLPKKQATLAVHREALARFLVLGLTETRERTGVLVYLSELEHRVEILADRGIEAHWGKDYWDAQVNTIVAGIRAGKPVDGIVEAVTRIGERLAEKFPRRADDKDELPNRVLTGDDHPSKK